ncbi:MAG TPA: 16S rRNA (cytidine(1402)-2'-O)-methyltransferase [bacterium]|jgi:16S rRNA (cytidine1402-2'-O)-methyltransferase
MTPHHSLRSGSGQTGTLYIVATPIGNLEDITLRALRVLRGVDVIACEDTRHTRLLLSRHGVTTALVSYHEHNEAARAADLVARLESGRSVALVSDAGTPLLSDPGFTLVREAVAHEIPVVAVPGPSAITAALAVSGLPTDRFLFMGFLPRRSAERRRLLQEITPLPYTLVFFEAPHRVAQTLADLRAALGDRTVAVVRELTKRFEEVIRGRLTDVIGQLRDLPPRGEFTLVVQGAEVVAGEVSQEAVRAHLATLLNSGVAPTAAAKIVTAAHRIPRRAAYQMALQLRQQANARTGEHGA